MFIVVRTLVRHTDGTHEGRILSRHRTLVAAGKAGDRLQASVRRDNGASSYLPTILAEWTGKAPAVGTYARDVRPVQIDG
jgi:hypothetical protein